MTTLELKHKHTFGFWKEIARVATQELYRRGVRCDYVTEAQALQAALGEVQQDDNDYTNADSDKLVSVLVTRIERYTQDDQPEYVRMAYAFCAAIVKNAEKNATEKDRERVAEMDAQLNLIDAALENYPDNTYEFNLERLANYATFGRISTVTKDAHEAVLACTEAVMNLYTESRANFGVIRAEYCDKDAADRDFENLAQAYFEEAQSCYDEAREEVDLLLDD